MTSKAKHRGGARWLRVTAILGFLLYIWGAPLYVQVLGGKSSYVHAWRMYSRIGDDMCRVRFLRVKSDGSSSVVDRFEELGHETAQLAPPSLRVLNSKGRVHSAGARLCSGDPEEIIRAELQCARGGRFGKVETTKNLCARVRPERGSAEDRSKRNRASSLQREFRRKATR